MSGLDDGAGIFIAENGGDDFARLFAVAGPVDFRAAGFQLGRQRFEMRVEMVDRFPFGFSGGLTRGFPALKGGLALVAHNFITTQRGADDLAMAEIAGFLGGARFEIGNESAH